MRDLRLVYPSLATNGVEEESRALARMTLAGDSFATSCFGRAPGRRAAEFSGDQRGPLMRPVQPLLGAEEQIPNGCHTDQRDDQANDEKL